MKLLLCLIHFTGTSVMLNMLRCSHLQNADLRTKNERVGAVYIATKRLIYGPWFESISTTLLAVWSPVQVPLSKENFSSFPNRPYRLWGPPSLLQFFPSGNALGAEFEELVELYLYSPYIPSYHRHEQHYFFLFS